MPDRESWRFEEGDQIAPGLHAVRLLGGGRRYEAYLAWEDELWTLVVAKIVRPNLVRDPGVLAGLIGEVRALSQLDHPAIVRSFGAAVDGERPHVVMEHLDGPRLSTLIRRFGVIVEQLLPLALELCSALHYMSRRGIVHLDVKPQNVIMSEKPRLIDLSVATPVSRTALLKTLTGTDAYMAPEQCDPARFDEIGSASDVWGLGVTLYEALTKTLPFPTPPEGDAAPRDRLPQLYVEPSPLEAAVPDALAETVMRCLEKDPANRPSALELAQTLEPWVAALPQARLGLFRPGGATRSGVLELA